MVASYAFAAKDTSDGDFFPRFYASCQARLFLEQGWYELSPCASLIARLVLSFGNGKQSTSLRQDPTWSAVTAEDWAIVEIGGGLICASLVPLKPLIHRMLPGLFSVSKRISFMMAPARPLTSDSVYEARVSTRFGHDPHTQFNTLARCSRFDETQTDIGNGITVTKDILITESPPEDLQKPEKTHMLRTKSLEKTWDWSIRF